MPPKVLEEYNASLCRVYNTASPPKLQFQLDNTDLLTHHHCGSAFSGKGEVRMGDLAFGDDLTQRLQWAKNMCVLFTSLAKDESGQSDTTRQVHITAGAQDLREHAQMASKTQKRLSDLLRVAKAKQVAVAYHHFKGTPTPVHRDAS